MSVQPQAERRTAAKPTAQVEIVVLMLCRIIGTSHRDDVDRCVPADRPAATSVRIRPHVVDGEFIVDGGCAFVQSSVDGDRLGVGAEERNLQAASLGTSLESAGIDPCSVFNRALPEPLGARVTLRFDEAREVGGFSVQLELAFDRSRDLPVRVHEPDGNRIVVLAVGVRARLTAARGGRCRHGNRRERKGCLLQCVSFLSNSAFHPFIDLLQRLCDMQRDDATPTKLDKLRDLLRQLDLTSPNALPLIATLLALPAEGGDPMTPPLRRQRTMDLLVEIFRRLASEAPMALVIEDLHWIDPSSLELIERLMDGASDQALLLVLSARPAFEPDWTEADHRIDLPLGRLQRHEASAIVEHLAGKPLPDEVLHTILDKTDGIPFFVEELTKTVLESGLLQETETSWELEGPLPQLAIPRTLHDSLMARLDRQPEAKRVAQQGSVLGREFSCEILHAAFPAHDFAQQRSLRQLVDAGLLLQDGHPPQARYVFKHALIQDTAYRSLLKSTRHQYHQRIAHALVAQFQSISQGQPERVAHHYTEAGLADLAIGYWQQAGQRALERSANHEAVSHFDRGLDVLQHVAAGTQRDQQELTLQASLGSAASGIHGFSAPPVERAYGRAFELCKTVDGAPELFWVYWGLWAFHIMRANLHEALELSRQMLDLASTQHNPGLEMEARFSLGSTHFVRGELAEAQAHLHDALALDVPGRDRSNAFITGQDVGVTSRSYLAMTLWFLGKPDQALAQSQDAIDEARRIDHPFSLISALASDSCLRQYRRETQATYRDAQEAIALSEKLGFFWIAQGQILMGWSLAMDETEAPTAEGRMSSGLDLIRQGLEALDASGSRLTRPYCLSLMAEAHLRGGDLEACREALGQAFDTVEASGERLIEADLHRLRGELQLADDASNTSAAMTSFRQAVDLARRQGAPSLEIRAAVPLARLQRQQDPSHDMADLQSLAARFDADLEAEDLRAARQLLRF